MSAKLATSGPLMTPTPSRAGSSGLWPSPPAGEAVAHHRDVGQPQEEPHLAQRVGQVDARGRRDRLARRAPGQGPAGKLGGDRIAALRMARHDHGQRVRAEARPPPAPPAAPPRAWVLAATTTGRAADHGFQTRQLACVEGQRIAHPLQVQLARRSARRTPQPAARRRRPAAAPGRSSAASPAAPTAARPRPWRSCRSSAPRPAPGARRRGGRQGSGSATARSRR